MGDPGLSYLDTQVNFLPTRSRWFLSPYFMKTDGRSCSGVERISEPSFFLEFFSSFVFSIYDILCKLSKFL